MFNERSQTKETTSVQFHLYEILEKCKLTHSDRGRSAVLWKWTLGVGGRDDGSKNFRMIDMLIILIIVMVSWIYTYQNHHSVHSVYMQFIIDTSIKLSKEIQNINMKQPLENFYFCNIFE
jgi:hypothetical protein